MIKFNYTDADAYLFAKALLDNNDHIVKYNYLPDKYATSKTKNYVNPILVSKCVVCNYLIVKNDNLYYPNINTIKK